MNKAANNLLNKCLSGKYVIKYRVETSMVTKKTVWNGKVFKEKKSFNTPKLMIKGSVIFRGKFKEAKRTPKKRNSGVKWKPNGFKKSRRKKIRRIKTNFNLIVHIYA